MKNTKVWIVTGASQGLGLATVKYLLSKGQLVVATTRSKEKFAGLSHENLEVISLDLNSEADVKKAVDQISETYGQIDVLINNAGFGFLGAVEEASQEEIEQVISINLYATMRMVRHVLPHMRAAKSGHIINLSSIAGFVSTPGFGIYNAAKFAVEGFSEAMSQELKDLGIKVTIIEPGAFRTNFLADSLVLSKQTIADYDATAVSTKTRLALNNGRQAGNPELAAAAIAGLTEIENPPLRLLLGQDAFTRAMKKLEDTKAEFERMESVSVSTGFEN